MEETYIVTVDPVRVPSRRRENVDFQHGIVRRNILKRHVRVPRHVGPTRDVFVSPVDATAFTLPVGGNELRGGLGDEFGGVFADGVTDDQYCVDSYRMICLKIT